jgi:hypothetical protein
MNTPDDLNSIRLLTRREIEARIVAPLLDAFSAEFGQERVLEIAQRVILQIARQQGAALAGLMGGCTLIHFAEVMGLWEQNDALKIEMIERSDRRLAYNITHCCYAEMYRDLGIPALGKILSCNRDFALVEGFNPEIKLKRTQTLMDGASHCDFRYEMT